MLPRQIGSTLARFRADERAIEGLPVRLVVALVVGVASLSVMLNMVQGIGGLAVTELDVRPEPRVVTPGERELTLTVVDSDGDPVSGATVLLKDGTAGVDATTATTGPNGTVTVTATISLGPNQEDGTLLVDVLPPAQGRYADRRGNSRVLVVAEG